MSWSQTTSASTGASLPTNFMAQQYGTGAMGDLVVATGTAPTLSKDSYYQNVTIQGTGQLKTSGWRLFVAGTLTISSSGSVNDDGASASGSSGGAALGARGSLGGLSGAGGNGTSAVANGTAGGGVTVSSMNNAAGFASGGAGGAASGGAQVGGAAGAATGGTTLQSIWGQFDNGRLTTAVTFTGGGGGGSGSNSTLTTATSGGGGGGAGGVWVRSPTLAGSPPTVARVQLRQVRATPRAAAAVAVDL